MKILNIKKSKLSNKLRLVGGITTGYYTSNGQAEIPLPLLPETQSNIDLLKGFEVDGTTLYDIYKAKGMLVETGGANSITKKIDFEVKTAPSIDPVELDKVLTKRGEITYIAGIDISVDSVATKITKLAAKDFYIEMKSKKKAKNK